MTGKTVYWYDFETFGSDPRRDRASQFAGIRTDEELNIVGDPLEIFCRASDDFLPSPEACLVTGITPQQTLREGVPEYEFARLIHEQFSVPDTCVAGYNSIRFDDEVVRQLFYRNFYDPYEREWKAGNSRWDIIDMVRLCAALRPEGINWPRREDGSISFQLDRLTVANDIEHSSAHDALADVTATIAMAKLVRTAQPKLYDYAYRLRSKQAVLAQIDLAENRPLLHVSSMYSAASGCLALVMPLCRHPTDNNGIIVYDLREDPDLWLSLPEEDIRRRIFSSQQDLPEGVARIPLKTLHINRCPMVATATLLDSKLASRYGIDLAGSQKYWRRIQSDVHVKAKVCAAFGSREPSGEQDPDFMIYSGGFFGEADRQAMERVRQCSGAELVKLKLPFQDSRLPEMLFRYRARNFPDTLTSLEQERWQKFRASRLGPDSLSAFAEAMEQIRLMQEKERDQQVIQSLEEWVADLVPQTENE
ncbi:MAG: exodeoxyribonuclease I [Pseudohongiellaceae bacterium]